MKGTGNYELGLRDLNLVSKRMHMTKYFRPIFVFFQQHIIVC